MFTFIAAFICALRISFFNCETQLLNSLLLANVIFAIFYTFSNLPQLVESLLYQSQLFQIALNLLVKVRTFGLQVLDCHVVCLQLLKVCQENILFRPKLCHKSDILLEWCNNPK